MTPIPTIVQKLSPTPSPVLTLIPILTSHTIYHVSIDNLSKLSNQANTLLVALIAMPVAFITAFLSYLFQRRRDRQLKEDEKREKLYAPLRLKLSTMRSIDKHIEKIQQAGDEASKDAQQIHDLDRSQEEQTKAVWARFAYSNQANDKWRECVTEVYELLQANPGLIRDEHHKVIDIFINAYIAVHYFEKQPSEEAKKLYPVKYYFDKTNLPYFEQAIKDLEKIILDK